MIRAPGSAGLLLLILPSLVTAGDPRAIIDSELRTHSELTGSYVLDRGEQALLARAWLVDHARRSIEVQYFIWSTDNIGIRTSTFASTTRCTRWGSLGIAACGT